MNATKAKPSARDPRHIRAAETVDAVLRALPEGWHVAYLGEMVTGIQFRGDTHKRVGQWRAELQHFTGGKLTMARDTSPAGALRQAIAKVLEKEAVDAG